MALKKKLTKAEFEKLNEAFKSEYIEDGEGYRLDVEGEEDTGALKRAKDRESQLRKDAEEKLKLAQESLDKITGDDARKKGDIETLEKSWNTKKDLEISSLKTGYEERINKLSTYTQKNLVENVAMQIASKISKSPALILPHIKARLQADLDGETPSTVILDASGKASALTIDQLSAEFVANKDFASIIIGSRASGSANLGDKNKGSAFNQNRNNDKPDDLSKMNPQQLAAYLKESKDNNEET